MAAFSGTPLDSTYLTNQEATNRDNLKRNDPQNLKVWHPPVYTHAAGAGTGEINLGKLPAGEITVYPDLCRIITSQFDTNADIHLGHRAYVEPDGDTVVEDDNEWVDNGDAGGAAIDAAFTAITGPAVYNSVAGIEVYAMIDTGNIEDGDTIEIVFVYGSAS